MTLPSACHGVRAAMLGLIALLLWFGSAPAGAGTDPVAPLATNLTGVNDFSDEFPFVNLMKASRDWIPGRAGCFDCRTPGSNPACGSPNICPTTLPLDADGYPTALNAAAQQEIRTVIHAGGTPGRLAPGNYTLRFDGAGTVRIDGGTVVSSSANEIVFNIASSTGNNIGFTLTAITGGNHPRNIRVLPPGGVCSNDERRSCDAGNACAAAAECRLFTAAGVAEQQIFQPRFLANAAPYRMLRFMDWMETNSSPVVEFAEYPTETSAFWHRVPATILAALGNRLRSDIWINIPHRASNAFIDQFATVLRDNFTADRRVYVEYSNENWNGIFSQNIEIPRQFCPAFADLAAGCQNDGVPDNGIACERDPNTFSLGAAQAPCFAALVRAWGDRSVQIFDRFDAVFGAAARTRTTRVIAAQAANADLGRQVMARNTTGTSSPVSSKTDTYSIAPYFGTEYCTPDNGFNPDTSPELYASATALLDHLESQALPRALGFMTSNRAMLTANFAGSGIRLSSYEGGQHLAGIGGFTFNTICNARFDEVNAHPRMEGIYRAYLANWRANGDEFTHFYNAGRWGPFGRWGALEFQDQAIATSPKYTALLGHSAANPCHWTGCVQAGGAPPEEIFGNGFEGAAQPACTPLQLFSDPGFEQTNPANATNPFWASTSQAFGSVLCSSASCPDDNGTAAPRAGTFWAWFGGIANAETATLSQSVVIPSGNPRHLNFFLRRGRVTAPLDATLVVRVDGTPVRTFTEPAVTEPAYLARTVDLSSFANGASHAISFDYVNPVGSGTSNFTVDDVTLECGASGN